MTPEQKLEAAIARLDNAVNHHRIPRCYQTVRAAEYEDFLADVIAAAREAGAAEERAKAQLEVHEVDGRSYRKGRDEERAAWRARIVEGSGGWWPAHPGRPGEADLWCGPDRRCQEPGVDGSQAALIRLPLPDEEGDRDE